jgi:hypothetical protein
MCGATGNRAEQISLAPTLSRKRARELEATGIGPELRVFFYKPF